MKEAERNGWIFSLFVLCFGLITILVTIFTRHIIGIYLIMIFAVLCFILVGLSDGTNKKETMR